MKVSNTRKHVFIGLKNPFLVCVTCGNKVPYRHNYEYCGCDNGNFNYPCEHTTGVLTLCRTWSAVDGCQCSDKETHDKE